MKPCFYFLFTILVLISCGSDDSDGGGEPVNPGTLTVSFARLGNASITGNSSVPIANEFTIGFNKAVPVSAAHYTLLENGSTEISLSASQGQSNQQVILTPNTSIQEGENYTLQIANTIVATDGSEFAGASFSFSTQEEPLTVVALTANDEAISTTSLNREFDLSPTILVEFSHPLSQQIVDDNIRLSPATTNLLVDRIDDYTYEIRTLQPLIYWNEYQIQIEEELGEAADRDFTEVSFDVFTTVDETNKFPEISDEALLTKIQEESFRYFWEFGHPVSGMARERNTSNETVTSGGTGFGLMAMVVAVERGFITRAQALERWQTVVNFLENADRFHGAWPHWMNGTTGDVIPFSQYDNGADLVETALLMQGLLTVQSFLNTTVTEEENLYNQIKNLWEEVEWTWFTKGGENVLYWHWSPQHEWQINLKIQGHNETQLVYLLAASSPTYPINIDVYEEGYARNGNMQNGNTYYDIQLPLGNEYGGPLFFSHYSYLGFDPRNLQDQYANYWTQNVNHSLINRAYCIDNPSNHIGYSDRCWGLTASDSHNGYSAHSPTNDLGVITPTAAISSLPYTPEESMDAIRFFYYKIGDRIWGDYGFYDAFNPSEEWYADSYLAIDQGPIIIMIENYRTGLIWDTFMQHQDIQDGLDALNFSY